MRPATVINDDEEPTTLRPKDFYESDVIYPPEVFPTGNGFKPSKAEMKMLEDSSEKSKEGKS